MPENLPTNLLGRTGLEIARLGYGASEIRDTVRGGRPLPENVASILLNEVLDAGINFIDTANGYGRSEEFIGKSISHRRSEYYLATKCGCYLDTHIWTRENVFRGLEESLRRLKTDHVDLMQLHGPTVAECEQGDFVGALEEMRDQGKTVWIGISTTLPDLPTYLEWGVFDTFQIPYSALERDHEDWITKAAAAGAGTIIRGGVSRGEPGGWLGNVERWRNYDAAGLDALRDQEESRTAFMLRFTLTHLGINTVIVGTLNPEHVRENVGAVLRGPLPPEVYAEAKRRLDDAGVRPRDSTS